MNKTPRKTLGKGGYRKENNENIKVIGYMYVGKRRKEVPPLDRNVSNVRVRGHPSDIVECNLIPSTSTTFRTHIQCPLSTTPLQNIRQNRSTVLSKTEAKVHKNTTNNNYLQVPLSATSRNGPMKSEDIRVDSSISRGTSVFGGNNVKRTFSRGSTNSRGSQFALLSPIATNRQSRGSDIPLQKTECRVDKSISRGNNVERTFSRGPTYSRGSQFEKLPPIGTKRQSSGSGISWQKTECSRGNSGITNRSRNVSASNRTVYSDLSQDISFNFTSDDESIRTAENDRKTKTCNKHHGDRCNSSATAVKHTERCMDSDINACYATYTGFKGHKTKTKSPDILGNKHANSQKDHKKMKEKIKQKEYVSSYLRINKLTSESKLDTKDQAIKNRDQSRRIESTQSRRTPLRSAGHLFKKSHSQTDRILVLEKLVDAAKSVGVICCNNIFHGTGFMVGGKYVFTALHVIRSMLGLSNCSVYEMKAKMETLLKTKSCSVIFNIYREHEQNMEHFHIEEHVPYYDIPLDIILLELKENFGMPFPVSLTNFDDLQFTDQFHLIGHPNGKPKERDADCVLLDISRDKADEIRHNMIRFLGDELSQTVLNTYGDPYHGIDDPDKCFFNCVFEHTASGAPAISIDQNGTVKACMVLLGGYPTFYWECCEDIKSTMPKDLRFEFGIKLSAVYASLKTHNASLSDRVFPNCPWAMFQ